MASSSSNGDVAASLPLLAIKEAVSRRVEVELTTGEVIIGRLVHMDIETGNLVLEDVLRLHAKSKAKSVDLHVAVKGQLVRMVRLPEIVKGAPFLQNVVDVVQKHLKRSRRALLDARKASVGKAKKDAALVTAKKLLKKQ